MVRYSYFSKNWWYVVLLRRVLWSTNIKHIRKALNKVFYLVHTYLLQSNCLAENSYEYIHVPIHFYCTYIQPDPEKLSLVADTSLGWWGKVYRRVNQILCHFVKWILRKFEWCPPLSINLVTKNSVRHSPSTMVSATHHQLSN